MSNQDFISQIAAYVKKYAVSYGILVHSPIIAQAILESGWGASKLAANYHNYFGLKCGTKWTGKSVNLTTQEEYTAGTLTTIKDNFRAYDSMEEGVKGYFEFIQLTRYQNLRGITDPNTYLETIKEDGYATSSTYVQNNMKLVEQYNLTQYDGKEVNNMANRGAASAWLAQYEGCAEGSSQHRHILAVFNDSGYCTRYKMTIYDAWCATGASAAFIATGLHSIFNCEECSCNEMIRKAQALGIWVEDDAYVPKTDDLILYDWDDNGVGDNRGSSDHVGVVVSCDGRNIRVIEANKNNTVGYRTLAVNGRYIRGFITPKFSGSSTGSTNTGTTSSGGTDLNKTAKWVGVVNASELNVRTWAGASNPTCSFSPLTNGTEIEVCDEVNGWYYICYNGKYGFVSADYVETRNTTPAPSTPTTSTGGGLNKNPQWVGRVIADVLNVRSWAGTENPTIKSYPQLSEGNLIDVCDTVQASNGDYWYYVRIDGRIYGFVHSGYVVQN